MAGIFELKPAAGGRFMFNLKAGNGEVILTSELYEAKSGAENGIASVRANAPHDERFDRRTSKRGEPYFVLKAANGEVIGTSEMYTATAGMANGIASVKTNAPDARLEDLTETPGSTSEQLEPDLLIVWDPEIIDPNQYADLVGHVAWA